MKLIFAFLLAVCCCQPAFAHPPKSVDVKRTGDKIEISVLHPVKNPTEHFIDRITLSLNGKIMIDQSFSAQQDAGQFSYYYVPFLKKGDKVSVNARCNKFGDLSKEIVVQ